MKTTFSIFTGIVVLVAAARVVCAANQLIGWGGLAAPAATNPIAITGGDGFSLALNANGTVSQNSFGFFVEPPTDLANVISIAAGDNVAIALRADGTVRVWGDISDPPADLTNVVAVSAGWKFCAVLKADGTVRCWGQLTEPPGLTNIVAISAGGSLHAAALKADGNVICWGRDFSTGGDIPALTKIPVGVSNIVAITAGLDFTVALKSNGTVVAWGDNPFGPTNVPPSLKDVVAVSAENASHVLALKHDGTVVAWGDNSDGQCNVSYGLTNVIAIATGSSHSMAIVGDAPPAIQTPVSPAWADGHFTMKLLTQSRRMYQAESTYSLSEPNWTALPLAAGNGALLSIHDFTATNTHRFYHILRW